MIGRTIAHYEITAKLGEGGMGVVYRARDTKLGRDVALKLLPETFARDPERMSRFEREARTLASLNNPHIAAIYGIEEHALVMELVDGPTLAERIAAGPIPLDEALPIARQIAEALEYAHEKGFMHRDLKPANVKLTADGNVKLLDFGLAKALEDRAPAGDPANSPTLTIGHSAVGVILGTAGYMSPEQARGAVLDKRTDIWAFGVVLFEMLSGKPMFRGESVSDTLAAVLRADPEWNALPSATPPRVRRLLRRCLERDRKKRLRDIGDAFLDVDIDDAPAPADRPKRTWTPWAAVAVCVVAALAVSFIHFREAPPQPPPARQFSFAPESLDMASSFVRRAVISPNGKHIAYVTQGKLWIRDLDQEEARPLNGGENVVGPFWSPDSAFVGFAAGPDLRKISVHGGAAIGLCKLNGQYRGGAWSPDGTSIVYSLAVSGLFEVPAQGGTTKILLPTVQGATFYAPQFLPMPAGRRMVLLGRGTQSKQSIELVSLLTRERRELHEGAYPVYSASGHILFQTGAQEAGLWALPFSIENAKPTGEAFPVVQQGGEWSLAADGTLVYVDFAGGELAQLIWRDRAGNKVGQVGQPQTGMRGVELSPDGSRVAVAASEQGNVDIWIHEVARPIKTRFTIDPATDQAPIWSPSGREIAFTSARNGNFDIFIRAADQSAEPKPLVATPVAELASSWSPDGGALVFTRTGTKTGADLWYLRRKPDGSVSEPVPFLQTSFNERAARISPNGRFVAYESDETGRFEVFVRPFPEGGGKWPVSANGGAQARWSRDGKELVYVEGDTLVAAPVSTAGVFSTGVPARLFRNSALPGIGLNPLTYDIAADGRRFLVAEPVEGEKAKPPSIHVVQNWQAVFRGR